MLEGATPRVLSGNDRMPCGSTITRPGFSPLPAANCPKTRRKSPHLYRTFHSHCTVYCLDGPIPQSLYIRFSKLYIG